MDPKNDEQSRRDETSVSEPPQNPEEVPLPPAENPDWWRNEGGSGEVH